jgi:hypothetical protein
MLEIKFRRNKQDHLIFQLYTASTSKNIKQKRRNSRLIVSLFYLVLGFSFIMTDNYTGLTIFIGLGIAWFFIYPKYTAYRYKKHYQKHIDETFGNDEEAEVVMEFRDDYIRSIMDKNECKIQNNEIKCIEETKHYIFIILKQGMGYILPKAKVAEYNELLSWLEKTASRLNINWNKNLDWKWK